MTLRLRELATVADFNTATGADVDERVVVAALVELRDQGWLSAAEPALTPDESAFLDAHGGVSDNRQALVKARVAARVRSGTLARENLRVEEVAELLQISASRVRHRLRDGTIYSYPSRGRGVPRTIPSWQFDDRTAIPHLAQVLDSLPRDFTSAEIRDFALNAEIDHPVNDATVPLLDWLRDGRDPAPAIELAQTQAQPI
jgi:hypothetical protein